MPHPVSASLPTGAADWSDTERRVAGDTWHWDELAELVACKSEAVTNEPKSSF